MVPNKHGRHTAARRTVARRTVATPLIAFAAVIVLAVGGWVLLGGGPGATPTAPVAATGTQPLTAPANGPSDRGTRATERAVAPPRLGGMHPAPATTTTSPAAMPTASDPARRRSPRPTPMPSGSPTAPATAPTTTAPVPPGSTSYATEVTRLTNVERGKAGCAAVKTDARLAAAALAHSKDMVDRDYFSHTSPDGKGPGDRATAAGYPSWSGENIAAGYPTPAAVVQGWMNSPGHKANILNCQSKATGVGYDARKNMWTQMFGFA